MTQERPADEVDWQVGMLLCGRPKTWQIGGSFVLTRTIQAAEADDQIAQGGQVDWSVAGPDGGGILAEGDIAHTVVGLDVPVASAKSLELGGVHLSGWTAAQEDLDVLGHADLFEIVSGASDDRGLDGVRKPGLFRGNLERIHLAGFMASVALVQGDVRREKKRLSAPETGG